MKRLLSCLLTALILAGFSVPAASGLTAPVAAAAAPPKVVLIVGPVGIGRTDRMRAQADEAARVARRYTPDVTKIYSPNATWPAVRKALQGASIVVYLGHGNGWPSRYRDSLYKPTQNGFGLNPVAGGGDSRHQYFGEKYVGEEIQLAKNAVVLLHHLCYASGNTEPGLPVGTLAQSKQRVDNYAAGFIKAGAAAVIAEAVSSPAYNVRTILSGGRSIERMWRNAPTANGNVFGFTSKRSPGYIVQMDPERSSSGYHRSIVLREGLASRDVLAGARGSAAASPADGDLEPSLVSTGIKLESPGFSDVTTAGMSISLQLPYTIKDRDKLPKSVKASVRWDPIDVAPVPLDPVNDETPAEPPTTEGAEPEPAASAEPEASASAEPVASDSPEPAGSTEPEPGTSSDPAASVDPSAAAKPATAGAGRRPDADVAPRREQPEPEPVHEPLLPPAPPESFALIQPEQLGDVVEPAKTAIKKKRLSVPVALPASPGLYRLTITLHDAKGVAYDAATQALVAPLLVRVVGEFDAKVLAAPQATLEAGSDVALDVKVVNLGQAAWGREAIGDLSSPDGGVTAQSARVIGHWVPLHTSASDASMPPVGTKLPAGMEGGGATADATLFLAVPADPGEYLLILDVVTPGKGSLAALGVPPTIVRITVVPEP